MGAGHDPAFFRVFDGQDCIRLEGRDIPLGVDPKWRYTEVSDRLSDGLLVLGTDGDADRFGVVLVSHPPGASKPQELEMLDVIYVLLVIGLFVAVALLSKGVERL